MRKYKTDLKIFLEYLKEKYNLTIEDKIIKFRTLNERNCDKKVFRVEENFFKERSLNAFKGIDDIARCIDVFRRDKTGKKT